MGSILSKKPETKPDPQTRERAGDLNAYFIAYRCYNHWILHQGDMGIQEFCTLERAETVARELARDKAYAEIRILSTALVIR